jgi:hypothetical protein
MPDFQNTAVYKPLENLQKNGNDGYLLEAGHFEMTNKSYCESGYLCAFER